MSEGGREGGRERERERERERARERAREREREGRREGERNLCRAWQRDLLRSKRDLLRSKRDILRSKRDLLRSKRDLHEKTMPGVARSVGGGHVSKETNQGAKETYQDTSVGGGGGMASSKAALDISCTRIPVKRDLLESKKTY